MSGPKRYAVQVFDDHLKDVFMLRARISTLWELLHSKQIRDDAGQKIYDNTQWLNANSEHYHTLQSLLLKTGGEELTQHEFDAFYSRIFHAIEKLAGFKERLHGRLTDFERVEADWAAYQKSALEADRLRTIFERMKLRFALYLEQNLNKEDLNTILKKIEDIEFSPVLPEFNPGEAVDYAKLADELKNEFERSIKKMNRLAVGSKPELDAKLKITLVEETANEQERINKLKPEIGNLLKSIRDENVRKNLNKKLDELIAAQKPEYFYRELLAEIRQRLSLEKVVNRLTAIRHRIEQLDPEKGAKPAAAELLRKINKYLNQKRLKPEMATHLEKQAEQLVRLNLDLRSQRLAAESEQDFIRARLIAELREMDYEVLTDMEVVDLENPNDLMFEIPDQENLMNLRLDEEGKMRYNFLIPENRHELSHEKTQQRLAEMEQNCEAFKKMLEKLKMQGLEIEPEHLLPATERHLISVPPRHQHLLDSRQKSESAGRKAKRKYRSR